MENIIGTKFRCSVRTKWGVHEILSVKPDDHVRARQGVVVGWTDDQGPNNSNYYMENVEKNFGNGTFTRLELLDGYNVLYASEFDNAVGPLFYVWCNHVASTWKGSTEFAYMMLKDATGMYFVLGSRGDACD